MTTRIKVLAAGLAALALAGPVAAQPESRRTTTTTTTTTTEFRKASIVMNANVVVEGGTTVGKITDFVISDGGCIEYVVVSHDEKYVLVPYQVVRVDPAQRVVSVSVTQEKWRDIPTFTGTTWPVTDQQYIGKVRTVFGVRESNYPRDGDRRPLDRRDDRQDRRDDRRDRRDDRRDPPQQPPQRRDVENPNRPADRPPADRPADRPPADRPPERGRDRPRDPNRVPPPPPPPPAPPPSSNPPPA